MRAFFIGLQFLTRISIVRQDNWTEEDFGRSVKYFPMIGAVLGFIYASAAYILFLLLPEQGILSPRHLSAAFLLLLPHLMTGGIHSDGFMDTMDGVFSGRSRERMLEIMKDSRTGSNAVFTFVTLQIFEFAILLDMPGSVIIPAMFVTPVIGRLMMAAVIVLFPYARREGIGHGFASFAGRGSLFFAGATTAIFIFPFGVPAVVSLFTCAGFTAFFARYVTKMLGGVTGDVYGATELLSEGIVLFSFLACSFLS